MAQKPLGIRSPNIPSGHQFAGSLFGMSNSTKMFSLVFPVKMLNGFYMRGVR